MHATKIYGYSLSQPLPYDETEMSPGLLEFHMNKLEEIINTPDDSDIGYFIEIGLINPDNIKEKTKNFPFGPEINFIP